MEFFTASEQLESSLDLLDSSLEDVETFDLLFPNVDDIHDDCSTSIVTPLDDALMQDLVLNEDLDTGPSNFIPATTESDSDTPNIATATKVSLQGKTQQTAPKQKSTRKLRHQRKKDELEYLRNQVTELENELETLKNSNKLQTGPQKDLLQSGGENDEGGDNREFSLWERVAKNQRKERVKAEVVNVKLREKLEGQLKIAKRLEKLLRKRPAQVVDGRASKMRTWRVTDIQGTEIFDILSRRVNKLHERVDAVMNEAGLAVVKQERNGAQVKYDDSGRVCVELVDAKISPFAVHDVAMAIWSTLSTKRIEVDNGYFKALDCTDDTVRAEFCVTLRLRRAEALVHMHILGKRVIQERRVVMTWATFGQTEGTPFDMERINLSESGWTVVEEMKACAMGGGTIVQSCVRLTPEFDDRPSQKSRVRVLTDLVIGSYGLNMQTLHQAVENCLVQNVIE